MNRTPLDDYLAEYLAIAMDLGHTPKSAQLPSHVLSGFHRYGLGIHDAARRVGITPNTHKRAPEPLPEHMSEPEEKIVVFEAPTAPNALTPEQLAEEREASRERVRRRMAEEPAHRPLPGTPRERSRAFRVGRAREEIDADQRAMREMRRTSLRWLRTQPGR